MPTLADPRIGPTVYRGLKQGYPEFVEQPLSPEHTKTEDARGRQAGEELIMINLRMEKKYIIYANIHDHDCPPA